MAETWILILMIVGLNKNLVTTTIEFNSKATCEIASTSVDREMQASSTRRMQAMMAAVKKGRPSDRSENFRMALEQAPYYFSALSFCVKK